MSMSSKLVSVFLFLSSFSLNSAQDIKTDGFDFASLQKLHVKLSDVASKVAGDAGIEGNGAEKEKQAHEYYDVSRAANCKTVCEIGFNAGHSAAGFLYGSPSAHYVGFDLGNLSSPVMANTVAHGKHQYTKVCMDTIMDEFATADPNGYKKKVEVVIGDSTVIVPKYALDHPEFRCDLIHVDGGHFGKIPIQDIVNMAQLSREDGQSIILLDDTTCEISNRDQIAGCIAPEDAWRFMKSIQVVAEDHCVKLSYTRGYCVGKYTPNARKILARLDVDSLRFPLSLRGNAQVAADIVKKINLAGVEDGTAAGAVVVNPPVTVAETEGGVPHHKMAPRKFHHHVAPGTGGGVTATVGHGHN